MLEILNLRAVLSLDASQLQANVTKVTQQLKQLENVTNDVSAATDAMTPAQQKLAATIQQQSVRVQELGKKYTDMVGDIANGFGTLDKNRQALLDIAEAEEVLAANTSLTTKQLNDGLAALDLQAEGARKAIAGYEGLPKVLADTAAAQANLALSIEKSIPVVKEVSAETKGFFDNIIRHGGATRSSATNISQWVQILRTGNITQRILGQGIGLTESAVTKLTGASAGMAAGWAVVIFIGSQLIEKLAKLASEMARVAFATETILGANADLVAGMEDVGRIVGITDAKIADLVLTQARWIRGTGEAADASEEWAKTIVRFASAFSRAYGTDFKTALGATEQFVRGNTRALNDLGLAISETDIEVRALELTGLQLARSLTEQQKSMAAVVLLTEEYNGVLDRTGERAADAESAIRDLKAEFAALADDIADSVPWDALFSFFAEAIRLTGLWFDALEKTIKVVDFPFRVARNLGTFLAGGRDTPDVELPTNDAGTDAINRVAVETGRLAQENKDASATTKQLAQEQRELVATGQSVVNTVNSYVAAYQAYHTVGGATVANLIALADAEQAVVAATEEDIAAFDAWAQILLDSATASEATGKEVDDLRQMILDLRQVLFGTEFGVMEESINRLGGAIAKVLPSQSELRTRGYAVIDMFVDWTAAQKALNAEMTGENILAYAKANEELQRALIDPETLVSLAAAVNELAQNEGAAGDAAKKLAANLGPVTSWAKSAATGLFTTAQAAIAAASGMTAAAYAAQLLATASQVATRIIEGTADGLDRFLTNKGPLKDTIQSYIGIYNSIANIGVAFGGVGSAASGAAAKVVESMNLMNDAISAGIARLEAGFSLADAQKDLADLQQLALDLPGQIVDANGDWLESLDALAEAQARLTREQEKSLAVTNKERAGIQGLQEELWLAEKAYRQGVISASELGAVQDELNEAIAASTAPTKDEEKARKDVESATKDVESAAKTMNDLKDRQKGIAQEIERAELGVLSAVLGQITAYSTLVDAQKELRALTGAELADWKELAIQAGISVDLINQILKFGPSHLGNTLIPPGGIPNMAPSLPGPGSNTDQFYTVQSGDWLSKIAAQFGTTWQTLYAQNRDVIGSDPNKIYPGQVINVTINSAFPMDEEMANKTLDAMDIAIKNRETASA